MRARPTSFDCQTSRARLRMLPAALLLAIAVVVVVPAVGCGTAEGSRYDSAPPPAGEAPGGATGHTFDPYGMSPGSTAGTDGAGTTGDPYAYADGNNNTSLDGVPTAVAIHRAARLDAAKQALADRQAQREADARAAAEAEAAKPAESGSESGAGAAVEDPHADERVDATVPYDGRHGYPYAQHIVLNGMWYRRVWVAPGCYYLDGEPRPDGHGGFIIPATSGARVWINQHACWWNPRTRAERRIAARRGHYPCDGHTHGYGGNYNGSGGIVIPKDTDKNSWNAVPGSTYRPYNTHGKSAYGAK